MLRVGEDLQLSATDLIGHLNCGHLATLDRQVVDGALTRPFVHDPLLEILRQRGALHEAAYIEHLRGSGLTVTVIDGKGVDASSVAATLAAMKSGAEVIVQAALSTAPFYGRADVLRRIEKASELGPWSYEVVDTKLSRATKGGTLLQLSLYSDLVGEVQGVVPEFAYVVAPLTDFVPERHRVADYAAYYRNVKERFVASLKEQLSSYPEPVPHCDICRWRSPCNDRRHHDDHLSLVAGISTIQRRELLQRGIATMSAFAKVDLPLPWKPERGSTPSFERAREQARIQVAGRLAGQALHETLPIVPGFGLARLPEPSEGDIFFDLEGDPFVGDGGLEYLFGYVYRSETGDLAYTEDWCFSRSDEKLAFERFIDFVTERRKKFPSLHIYHYAPYEPGALKRLMGRYASREQEMDGLLRGQVLVDLYAVVRHAIRASVESYSIKRLEPLYGFDRAIALTDANSALSKVQACLELGDVEGIDVADRGLVAGYNRDDCVSTLRLRDWLEGLRSGAIASGTEVPRPVASLEEASPDVTAWQAKIDAVVPRLLAGVPIDPADRTAEQQALYILGHILDWHRRERKATWWEHFRLADLSAEQLLDEKVAISGLSFVQAVGGTARAPVHRYSFPPQEVEMRNGDDLRSAGGERLGKVDVIDLDNRLVDIKKRGDTAMFHPEAFYKHGDVNTAVLAESLLGIGQFVAEHGIAGAGRFKAARDLLLRLPPTKDDQHLARPGETVADAACRLALTLDGVLPIQGPPGAGKTYTGGKMIVELVRAGKRVGVTANSHKVIKNLLDAAVAEAASVGYDLQCVHKVTDDAEDLANIRYTTNNEEALAGFDGGADVVAGTGWLWARADAADRLDVLFVDEAAQMSLANVLAISPSANSVVLLGDPRQLEQPTQGSHPEGTEVSALDHLLNGRQTIGDHEGLFLDQTWRLHPSISAFTSELFYEARLHSRPGLENQAILMPGALGGNGLRYVPISHTGNQSSSPEEADCVASLVGQLLAAGTLWRDRSGQERSTTLEDILVIAPYNAQVFEIQARLNGARVGTVDKFQGQEAPVVIYSVTTSSHADAPRGMDFL